MEPADRRNVRAQVTDTIFALSSGAPPAAIAVVRVSGPAATAALERLGGSLPEPRRMVLRSLRDPESRDLIDRCLVVWFPAQTSVTGEPLVELHLHGGRATVAAVEAALGRVQGLRPARAGEFTWQAFRKGKMDLVEVESLSDLLRAETESQRRAAQSGTLLSREVEGWRRDVLQLSALVEAQLDQSDEDDVPADRQEVEALAGRLIQEIGARLNGPAAERLFDGVRVVLAGPPNSGKSSLINALAQREVAIISSIAGTTRDVIEAPVLLGGTAFILTDTAGLRQHTPDALEEEGIRRAEERLRDADIVLWLGEEEPPVLAAKLFKLAAKSDLGPATGGGRLAVSARTGEGLQQLTSLLIASARDMLPSVGEVALSRRQRTCLSHCLVSIRSFSREADELIAAEHLRAARRSLDELTGRSGTEDMLDALFATFCVGK